MAAPVVTVEDGTIVANANSFVEVGEVTAYAVNLGDPFGWVGTPPADLAAATIKGGQYVCNEMRYKYRGVRVSYAQTMVFPREGASEYRGPAIPNNVIPWRLKAAQCEAAMRSLATDLQATLERGGKVKSENVAGAVTTTYADDAPGEDLITVIQGILQPLLLTRTATDLRPVFVPVDQPGTLVEGAFDFPGLPSFDK